MLIDIHIKFREDILNGFELKERTYFSDGQSSKGNNSKSINEELWLLRSARRLVLIDIYMKFLEEILNMIQVTERTRFRDGQSSKGNNSKSIHARVMVLAVCMLSNVD